MKNGKCRETEAKLIDCGGRSLKLYALVYNSTIIPFSLGKQNKTCNQEENNLQ